MIVHILCGLLIWIMASLLIGLFIVIVQMDREDRKP